MKLYIAIIGFAFVACKPSPAVLDAGGFAAELETCLQFNTTCEEFVECQHKVQAKYNQPIEGSCPDLDAGKDAE